MATDLSDLHRHVNDKPNRIVLYGPPGIGKTSLAASFPEPVFFECGESGLGELEVPTFGLLDTYNDVLERIGALVKEDHPYKTAVFDTIDSMEALVWRATCERMGYNNGIESPGYGRGYNEALEEWREFRIGTEVLRKRRDMTIIFLAHSKVSKIEPPESDAYTRYQLKMKETASAMMVEQADYVWFLSSRTSLVREEKGQGAQKQVRARGVGRGARILYTQDRPAFLAKSRGKMPAEVEMPDDPEAGFDTLAPFIPYYSRQMTAAA